MQLKQSEHPNAKYDDRDDITRHGQRVTDYVDRPAD